MVAKQNPGALAGATGAGRPIHATPDGLQHLTHKFRTKEADTSCRIAPSAGEPFWIVVKGRVRWTAYVHRLRELGVTVEIITEPNAGAFPNHHAPYVLRCRAAPDWAGGAA